MDLLPPHLKHKILSLDTKLSNAVYGDNREEKGNKYPSLLIKDPTKLKSLSSSQITSLEKDGYIIIDQFLGRDALTRYKIDGINMYGKGELRPSRMNKGEEKWKQEEIRGDEIKWLNFKDEDFRLQYHGLTELLDRMDSLRIELDDSCEFKSTKSQVQIARYSAGTRYVRHRDAFVGSSEPSRRLTTIYYMNESWKSEDGGYLRMFLGEDKIKDVEPIGDRLLIFWSAYVDHEVILSNSERYATTMWFY